MRDIHGLWKLRYGDDVVSLVHLDLKERTEADKFGRWSGTVDVLKDPGELMHILGLSSMLESVIPSYPFLLSVDEYYPLEGMRYWMEARLWSAAPLTMEIVRLVLSQWNKGRGKAGW